MTHLPVWLALFGGLVLGFVLGRVRGHGDRLDLSSTERKQMMIAAERETR